MPFHRQPPPYPQRPNSTTARQGRPRRSCPATTQLSFPAGGRILGHDVPTWKTAHPPGAALCIDRHRRPRPSSAACGPEAWARWPCWPGRSWSPASRRPAPWPPAGHPGWRASPRPAPPAPPRRSACRSRPGSGDGRRRPRPSATGWRPGGRPAGPAPPPPRPPGWSRPAAVPPSRPSPFVPTARPRRGRPGSTRTAGCPGRSWPASGASSPTMACSGGRGPGSAPAGR